MLSTESDEELLRQNQQRNFNIPAHLPLTSCRPAAPISPASLPLPSHGRATRLLPSPHCSVFRAGCTEAKQSGQEENGGGRRRMAVAEGGRCVAGIRLV